MARPRVGLDSLRQQPTHPSVNGRLMAQLPGQPRRLSREARQLICGPQAMTLHNRPAEALVSDVLERLRGVEAEFGAGRGFARSTARRAHASITFPTAIYHTQFRAAGARPLGLQGAAVAMW